MNAPSAPMNRLGRDDASWGLMLLLAALLLGLQAGVPFTLDWAGTLPAVVMVGIFGIIGLGYRKRRKTPEIPAMLAALSQAWLFAALGAILSYMLAARSGPLWDSSLFAADRALGLDWRSYLAFVDSQPWLAELLSRSYRSLIPQLIVLIVALSFLGKLHAMRVVICASILTGMVTIILSGFFPAVGNFVFLGLGPADYPNLEPAAAFVHMHDFEALRAGSLRTLTLPDMQGIVTFPSYHAALAAIYCWGFYHARLLRWPGMIVSALTILATPIDGGHYFIDVIAGLALAAAGIWIARRAVLFDALRAARHLLRRTPDLAPA